MSTLSCSYSGRILNYRITNEGGNKFSILSESPHPSLQALLESYKSSPLPSHKGLGEARIVLVTPISVDPTWEQEKNSEKSPVSSAVPKTATHHSHSHSLSSIPPPPLPPKDVTLSETTSTKAAPESHSTKKEVGPLSIPATKKRSVDKLHLRTKESISPGKAAIDPQKDGPHLHRSPLPSRKVSEEDNALPRLFPKDETSPASKKRSVDKLHLRTKDKESSSSRKAAIDCHLPQKDGPHSRGSPLPSRKVSEDNASPRCFPKDETSPASIKHTRLAAGKSSTSQLHSKDKASSPAPPPASKDEAGITTSRRDFPMPLPPKDEASLELSTTPSRRDEVSVLPTSPSRRMIRDSPMLLPPKDGVDSPLPSRRAVHPPKAHQLSPSFQDKAPPTPNLPACKPDVLVHNPPPSKSRTPREIRQISPHVSSQKPKVSLRKLTLLKWKDQDVVKTFRLLDEVSGKWQLFGTLLGLSTNKLLVWEKEHPKNITMCCNKVMEYWLVGGCTDYPATWEGMYTLLEDAELSEIAKELKKAIDCPI